MIRVIFFTGVLIILPLFTFAQSVSLLTNCHHVVTIEWNKGLTEQLTSPSIGPTASSECIRYAREDYDKYVKSHQDTGVARIKVDLIMKTDATFGYLDSDPDYKKELQKSYGFK